MGNTRIGQIIFYQDKDKKNYSPDKKAEDITRDLFINPNNNIFSNFVPFSQIGVQSLPGTKFYLNGNSYPIIIGSTGVYEIETRDGVEISSISIDTKSMDLINNNPNSYLIVDFIRSENIEGGNK